MTTPDPLELAAQALGEDLGNIPINDGERQCAAHVVRVYLAAKVEQMTDGYGWLDFAEVRADALLSALLPRGEG